MKYISTRGKSPELNFCDVLLGGLAPDGGLYLPKSYPKFTVNALNNFHVLVVYCICIFEKFIDDIPAEDLKVIINKTYTPEVFAYNRTNQDSKEITPTLKLKDNLYLLSLSNGPTLAFKDIAMQFLGHIFEYVFTKKNKTLNILVCIFIIWILKLKGKKGINVFMLSPYGTMSPFQHGRSLAYMMRIFIILLLRACLMIVKIS